MSDAMPDAMPQTAHSIQETSLQTAASNESFSQSQSRLIPEAVKPTNENSHDTADITPVTSRRIINRNPNKSFFKIDTNRENTPFKIQIDQNQNQFMRESSFNATFKISDNVTEANQFGTASNAHATNEYRKFSTRRKAATLCQIRKKYPDQAIFTPDTTKIKPRHVRKKPDQMNDIPAQNAEGGGPERLVDLRMRSAIILKLNNVKRVKEIEKTIALARVLIDSQ